MEEGCKKAWKWKWLTIEGEKYKVRAILGCERCNELAECEKEEAVCVRAGQKAVGLVNKLVGDL